MKILKSLIQTIAYKPELHEKLNALLATDLGNDIDNVNSSTYSSLLRDISEAQDELMILIDESLFSVQYEEIHEILNKLTEIVIYLYNRESHEYSFEIENNIKNKALYINRAIKVSGNLKKFGYRFLYFINRYKVTISNVIGVILFFSSKNLF